MPSRGLAPARFAAAAERSRSAASWRWTVTNRRGLSFRVLSRKSAKRNCPHKTWR